MMMNIETDIYRQPPIHSLMTLVLNATFEPLTTYPLSVESIDKAIKRLSKNTAQTVETWKDAYGNDRLCRSPSVTIPAPKVVVLKRYIDISSEPKFSRRSVLLRDRFCCQYCGRKFTHSKDLTFDHVVPRSQGGRTVWSNIVMACEPCNSRKSNKMPQYSGRKGKKGNGLRPLKEPYQPTNAELLLSLI